MNDLTRNRWQQIDTLFGQALEQPPQQRTSFVLEACGADTELRNHVEKLLRLHKEAGGILGESAGTFAAPLLPELMEQIDGEPFEGPGSTIGPYRIIEELGRGGTGTVWLATKTGDPYGVQVAVKLLRRGMDTRDVLRRFRHEGRILAALKHPNIARLYDGGVHEDGRPYFVMEYIKGEPIDEYCDRHHLSIEERLRLFITVCETVQHAHQNLVVHRDLKPAHVLVTPGKEIKLVDFGIAKLLEPDRMELTDFHTREGVKVMTPDFAAPEQVRGEPVTTASDLYSLGVLLYLLLTGRRPYRVGGASPLETERIVCQTDPIKPSEAIKGVPLPVVTGTGDESFDAQPSASFRGESVDDLRRTLSGDLDQIVLMALRKEPERRYRSALGLAEDLQKNMQGQPVAARSPTLRYRAGKFVRRNKWVVAAAAVTIISIITGLGTALWQAQQARLAAEQATNIKEQLIELFINPDKPQEAVATTQDFLDHGVTRLRELPPGDPLREDLAGVLVGLYNQLTLRESAERLAETELEGIRLAEVELGGVPVDPERAANADLRLVTEWATAKWTQGTDQDTVWRTLVLATERKRGEAMLLADALTIRARIGIATNRFYDAEKALRRAIAVLEPRVPATDRRMVTARYELAAALVGQRKNTQGRAETERLLADVLLDDTRLRQRVLVMAAVRRALFGEFEAAETLFAENDAIRIRRDSTDVWSFDEVSRAVNAFDSGDLAKSEAVLELIIPNQVIDMRVAEIHWVRGELSLHCSDNETAAALFGEALRLETRTRLRVYYAALHAVALDRAGHAAGARSAIVSGRSIAAEFEAPNVAMALLEAADAAISSTKPGRADQAEGFMHALAILDLAKEHPAVLEDQLKENRDAVRIRLWKARFELDAGDHERARATITEALTLGRATLGGQHPFVRELERLRIH